MSTSLAGSETRIRDVAKESYRGAVMSWAGD
jgi:hypothetical protein